MMNNLFSMFDPSSSFLSMSWVVILVGMIFSLKKAQTKMASKMNKLILLVVVKVKKEMEELSESNKKMSTQLLVKVFTLVVLMNILALFPFNFTPTAHLSISFSMSMTLWMSIMIVGLLNIPKNVMIHLTPTGCPNSLMNFMVLIETISLLIRPITLSVRMSANMVAGHLLLSLLSNFSIMSMSKSILSSSAMVVLIFLELAVAFIQGYVFITLVMLYQNEMK